MANIINKIRILFIFYIFLFQAVIALNCGENCYSSEQIKEAMDRGDIIAHVQPLFHLEDGTIASGETLARWIDGDKIIMPDDYIPQMEKTPLIKDFDLYMFKRSSAFIKRNIAKGYLVPTIAVNLSKATLSIPGVAYDIIKTVIPYGIIFNKIGIEVTETFDSPQIFNVIDNVRILKNAGFKIYIDDFGVGFNSEADIDALKPDVVKLDKSFVPRGVLKPEAACENLKPLLNKLAQKNITVLIEGLESAEDVRWALNCGIKLGQGFYFGRPMPPDEFEKMISYQR